MENCESLSSLTLLIKCNLLRRAKLALGEIVIVSGLTMKQSLW